jgi:WXG100 family type VII secretion target
MSLKSFLLKIARRILEQVLSVINQQINIVQQQVLDYLMNFINQTDQIWRGDDADVFVAEFKGQIAPALQQLVGATTNTHNGIRQAADCIDAADQKVRNMVDDLVNDFTAIFS